MSIKIDQRSKKVIARLKGLDKSVPRNLRNGMYNVGAILKRTASNNILKRGRQGNVYRYKGRRHVASSPGESWANRSGEARRGLVYKVRGAEELLFGNTTDYAKHLEFGTKNMKPRPAHLISIKENNKNIVAIMNNAIKKSLLK